MKGAKAQIHALTMLRVVTMNRIAEEVKIAQTKCNGMSLLIVPTTVLPTYAFKFSVMFSVAHLCRGKYLHVCAARFEGKATNIL